MGNNSHMDLADKINIDDTALVIAVTGSSVRKSIRLMNSGQINVPLPQIDNLERFCLAFRIVLGTIISNEIKIVMRARIRSLISSEDCSKYLVSINNKDKICMGALDILVCDHKSEIETGNLRDETISDVVEVLVIAKYRPVSTSRIYILPEDLHLL